MIARLRRSSRRLTVPHVLSALALFVALGGTAVAVGIAKNSVGSPQIKPAGVKTSDVANGAVTTKKLRGDAVTSGKVKNGSLRAADIDQATLTNVRAANVIAVTAEGDGQCTLVNPPAGVSATHPTDGTCLFTFSRDVSSCGAVASVDLRFGPNQVAAAGARSAYVERFSHLPNQLRTRTFIDFATASGADDGIPSLSDLALTLTLVC